MPEAHGVPGTPPRTFILRLLNFRDQDLVLRESRKIEALRFKGSRLMIFLDFSVETQKQSKSFDHVKLTPRQKGLKYSMFPARLRVQDEESHRFFTSPEDASNWLESLPQRRHHG